ncbi:MAG TPA: zinc ribbon domain-containing protein [Acidobacteriaceae bacterium]|nr:zinc ribbon domain-containing protein [Acidobacteriaceae bacterium]
MYCPACGKENAASVSFCTFCGFPLASAVPAGAPATAVLIPSAPAGPSAAANAGKMATSFLASLSLAEKIIGGGAVIAVIGFFLPFIAIPGLGDLAAMAIPDPTGGNPMPSSSLSLLGLTKFAGAVYFILLGALASAGLLYLSRTAAYARKMLLSGIQVMIGSMVGPGTLLALLFASSVRSVAGVGFWVVSLGYCCIVAGGMMTIAQLSKAER